MYWQDYGMPAAFSWKLVDQLLRDRRLGRQCPPEMVQPVPDHLVPFYDVEAHSMLELEPPRHTRLRGLVLRAFTTRRIAAMAPEIEALCHSLIDGFEGKETDLLASYAQRMPVIVIARLLGIPEEMGDDLLAWSHAMVAMYQAQRSRETENRAAAAATDFVAFLRGYAEERRTRPADDLITHLLQAEQDGDRLSMDELITTCILLLNAGHEATVHTMGNGIKTLLEQKTDPSALAKGAAAATTEEIIRYDPPLHMFTRYVYAPFQLQGHRFNRGDQVALMLAAANRDEAVWQDAHAFNPRRTLRTNASFGAGLHFCVGAPLARLELEIGLRVLWQRCWPFHFTEQPSYAPIYHFHGLSGLRVAPG